MDVGATLTLAGEGSAGTTAVDFGAHASTSKMTLAKASAYTSDVVIDATDTSVDTNATNAVEVTPHATFISGTLTLVDNDTNGGSADDVAKWTFVNNSLATYADSLGAAGAATEGDVIVDPGLGYSLPPKDEVYNSIEGLIYHFEVTMPNRGMTPPVGEAYVPTESPNGELGFYIVSDGNRTPYRVRTRPPSFMNYSIFSKLIEGHMLSDAPAILGSINIIAGELDR
jgi:hypothetical protein